MIEYAARNCCSATRAWLFAKRRKSRFARSQVAGRIESKIRLKNMAYCDLFKAIFQYKAENTRTLVGFDGRIFALTFAKAL